MEIVAMLFSALPTSPGDPASGDRRDQQSPPTLSGFAKASARPAVSVAVSDLALGYPSRELGTRFQPILPSASLIAQRIDSDAVADGDYPVLTILIAVPLRRGAA